MNFGCHSRVQHTLKKKLLCNICDTKRDIIHILSYLPPPPSLLYLIIPRSRVFIVNSYTVNFKQKNDIVLLNLLEWWLCLHLINNCFFYCFIKFTSFELFTLIICFWSSLIHIFDGVILKRLDTLTCISSICTYLVNFNLKRLRMIDIIHCYAGIIIIYFRTDRLCIGIDWYVSIFTLLDLIFSTN